LGIVVCIAFLAWTQRKHYRVSDLVDACLAALISGLIFGRAFHVLLAWDYFVDHPGEITRLNAGGLEWHGALFGAWLGIWIVSKFRKFRPLTLAPTLAFVIPIIGFAAWRGCEAATCAYGAEVTNMAEYPAWAVWEGSDIFGLIYPRFHTQWLGMMLSLVLLLLALILTWRNLNMRFGLILGLFSVGMFMIGFLRGDAVPYIAGLRAEQWLDLLTTGFAIMLMIFARSPEKNQDVGIGKPYHQPETH
jgi:prolipoprotein diacylglyceryltransferase